MYTFFDCIICIFKKHLAKIMKKRNHDTPDEKPVRVRGIGNHNLESP